MTVYAIGDYHGRSIEELIEKEKPTSKDTILSTGDFDQIKIIKELLELKKELGENSVIDVPGNHDHAILNKEPITSGTIEAQDKHYHEMIDELHNDAEAKNYIESLMDTKIKEFEIQDLNGILVHGGLDGHIQSPQITEEIAPLWHRLWDDKHFEDNFDIMDKENYDIMIRGHDHRKDHAYRLKDAYKPTYRSQKLDQPYKLDSNYNHIITHGAWYEGEYIAIDEETLEIEFKSI